MSIGNGLLASNRLARTLLRVCCMRGSCSLARFTGEVSCCSCPGGGTGGGERRTHSLNQPPRTLRPLLLRPCQRRRAIQLLIRPPHKIRIANPLLQHDLPRPIIRPALLLLPVPGPAQIPRQRDVVVLDGRGAPGAQRERFVEEVGGPEEDGFGLGVGRGRAQAVVAEGLAEGGRDGVEVAGDGEFGDFDGVNDLGVSVNGVRRWSVWGGG